LAPAAIFGQPIAWAGVGSANEASNQRLTGSLNTSRGVDLAVSGCTGLNLSILRIERTRYVPACRLRNVETLIRAYERGPDDLEAFNAIDPGGDEHSWSY